jgi:hypothetical protein
MGEGEIRARRFNYFCTFAFALVVVLAAGCGAKSNKGTVTGTVTLDGQPIKAGLIHFAAVDGLTPTADAAITDGKFKARVPPGDKKVSISAPKVTGQRRMYETPNSPMIDITEESVPKQYNAQTTLKYTVAAGSQQKDFELTSKK